MKDKAKKSRGWPRLVLSLALVAGPAFADVWDQDPDNEDDAAGTDNELYHGVVQLHDLQSQGGAADQDWYYLGSRPFSSYEVLVDGLQGELFYGVLPVDLVDVAGTVLVPGATPPGGLGAARSLRWENATASPRADYVRVAGTDTACGTTCTANTQYTIRMWETTLAIPRFNNSGTQMTVLLLQNPSTYTIAGHVYYWSGAGALIASQPFSAGAKALIAVSTSTQAPNASGSITITHDGRLGDIAAKTVALEPATGFSFDTAAVTK